MINYVKNQPLGATKQAGKACFVNMNVCILQKDSPTWTSNNTISCSFEQVVYYTAIVNLEVNLENKTEHKASPQLAKKAENKTAKHPNKQWNKPNWAWLQHH